MAEEQPKNNLLEYREKAIQLMDFLFGERVDPDSPGVKYKNYTNTKIEEILSSNRSQISRLLKDPNLWEKQPLSEEAIKIIIIKLVRVLDLKELGTAAIKENTRLKEANEKLKNQTEVQREKIKELTDQLDGQQQKYTRSKRSLVMALIGLGIIGILTVAFRERESSKARAYFEHELVQLNEELAYARDHYVLRDEAEVKQALYALSAPNITQIQVTAALFNIKVKEMNIVAREDSIMLVGDIKSTLIDILGNRREKEPMYNKLVTKKKTKLVDLLNRTVRTGSMFACSDSLLAFVKTEHLPDSATLFDRGLSRALPFIFSQEKELEEVMKNAGEQVSNVQKKQADMIAEILRQEEGY